MTNHEYNKRRMIRVAVFAAFIILVFSLLGMPGTYDDEVEKLEEYCRNIKLHQESNGKYGWPNYAMTADQQDKYCKENKDERK